ncbi:MAG: hypothetical protein LUE17_00725 [Planctomycetaceae bacterium]|nr:hypothetical protein [Planctomycetaceae bacterium]
MIRVTIAIALTITAITASHVAAGENPAQRICPVTQKPLATVAHPVRVQVEGFTFLVADEASRAAAMESSPSALFAALAKNGDAAEPVSQACPIMGNRINLGLAVQKDGYRVYLCCKGCAKRVQNNWDATLRTLRDQADVGDPENLPAM